MQPEGFHPPAPPVGDAPLLRVQRLCTVLHTPRGPWRAVEDVSFDLRRGAALGLVGESGSGKSTLCRTILRLIPAASGQVWFDGREILGLPRSQLRGLRRRMQMVFQDPAGSLNPRLRIETIVGEALQVHGLVRGRRERNERVAEMLRRVGLSADDLRRYPHEFSGGQRQRIGIARALILRPELLICDEPVSALDVSVRAQVLNLLADLKEELGLTLLLVAHDLGVVRSFCDEVAVLHAGRIVEHAAAEELFSNPRHACTRRLLEAAPSLPG